MLSCVFAPNVLKLKNKSKNKTNVESWQAASYSPSTSEYLNEVLGVQLAITMHM